MAHNQDYSQKTLLEILNSLALEKNVMQIIDFTTWSRTVKGNFKQSLLDHVYVSNFAMVENVDFEVPTFGDHVSVKVKFAIKGDCYQSKIIIKQAWSMYSSERVCKELNDCSLQAVTKQCMDAVVQEHWNVLENVILTVIDSIAPVITSKIDPTNIKVMMKGPNKQSTINKPLLPYLAQVCQKFK